MIAPRKSVPFFIWKLPAIGLAAFILYMALTPPPEIPLQIPFYDKVLHFGAFFALSLLAALPFRQDKKIVIWSIILPIAFGAFIELLQMTTRTRQAELVDLVADIIGTLIGFGIALIITAKQSQAQHQRIK